MTTFPVLTTDRLILRAPGAADTYAMLGFLASDHAKFYGGPMNADAAWHKFSAYVGQWTLRGYGFFAITLRDSGNTIGMAGPHHPDHFPEPEMSWLLTSDEHESKGYASEACRAVLSHLFTDLGWTTCVSYVDRANTASRILAERLGATLDTDSPALISGCDTYRHTAEAVA
ncbi:GNAT family N-acetyltransferase [Alisedimentitalea sp. MJ-SS2]|uniref:GNAT family N-acetyltransferase n=1 Tax=Aliisedimentitalea sp. MJ-SS2 TaxID=3049795 RepID=UPI00291097A1|nr:GNAT family N-acetyltransferase [Alisedimentitalea sp. MJ-SS2]MDU8927576.1 GNAT family N-acetyltransferase [Alisedimentitalea sp. MJ-SS2]